MAKANGMKNLKSRKLYLQVYDEIKSYIEKNHLMPGDKLPSEMKMCEMLGVSRNVLREAIKSRSAPLPVWGLSFRSLTLIFSSAT